MQRSCEQDHPEAHVLQEMMHRNGCLVDTLKNTRSNKSGPIQTHHKPRQARAPGVPNEDARAGLEGQRLGAPGEGDPVVFLTVHVETHLSDKEV